MPTIAAEPLTVRAPDVIPAAVITPPVLTPPVATTRDDANTSPLETEPAVENAAAVTPCALVKPPDADTNPLKLALAAEITPLEVRAVVVIGALLVRPAALMALRDARLPTVRGPATDIVAAVMPPEALRLPVEADEPKVADVALSVPVNMALDPSTEPPALSEALVMIRPIAVTDVAVMLPPVLKPPAVIAAPVCSEDALTVPDAVSPEAETTPEVDSDVAVTAPVVREAVAKIPATDVVFPDAPRTTESEKPPILTTPAVLPVPASSTRSPPTLLAPPLD